MIDSLLESNDKDEEYYSWDAMKMLDYKGEKVITGRVDFGIDGRRTVYGIITKFNDNIRVDDDIVQQALGAKEIVADEINEDKMEKLRLNVRECFDELYFRMGQLEDAIHANLVMFEDVKTPIDYYVGLMAEDVGTYYKYLSKNEYNYGKTLRYLDRFEKWKEAIGKLPKCPPSP
jgi:hypothetical protein